MTLSRCDNQYRILRLPISIAICSLLFPWLENQGLNGIPLLDMDTSNSFDRVFMTAMAKYLFDLVALN